MSNVEGSWKRADAILSSDEPIPNWGEQLLYVIVKDLSKKIKDLSSQVEALKPDPTPTPAPAPTPKSLKK